MKISAPDWKRLSSLLDEAMDQPAEQREQWLEQLDPAHHDLRDTLRDILLAEKLPLETGDVLRQLADPAERAGDAVHAPGDLVGPYRLLQEIGTGGMSTVWLAERADGAIERKVALKLPHRSVIDKGFGHRAARERDILARLEHPNIARLYDVGVDDAGQMFMALEYVRGESPEQYSTRCKLDTRARLNLFLQVMRAVAFAHEHLVIHRDIKPSNILVTDEGEVRLLDFGIARLLREDSQAPNADEAYVTHFSERPLTPAYAAPEQFLRRPVTVATDIYSLAVVLFELLTGKSPYNPQRRTVTGFEQAVLDGDLPLASQMAPSGCARVLRGDVDAILAKALALEPVQRYSSVEAFAGDIQRYLAGEPVKARLPTLLYITTRFVRRHRVLVGSTVAITIALVAGASVALWQARAARIEARRAEQTSTFVLSLFKSASPASGGGVDLRVVDLLVSSLPRIEQDLSTQPAEQLALYATVGQGLNELNAYKESLSAFDKALQHAQRHGLERSPAVIDVLLGKAHALIALSDLPGGAVLLDQAEKQLAGQAPGEALAELWSIRSFLELESRNKDEALLAAARSSQIRRELHGTTDLRYLESLIELSRARYHTNQCADAMQDIEFALEQLPKTLRADSHPTIAVMGGLRARCLKDLGRYRDALIAFDTNSPRIKAIFGEQSRDYGITLYEHADAANEAGEPARAVELATQALKIVDHLELGSRLGLNITRLLTLSLVQLRRLEPATQTADRYYREALQTFSSPDHATAHEARMLQALISGLRGTVDTAPATLRKIQENPAARPFSIAEAQLYRGWLDLLANRSAEARARLEPAAAYFASDGEWSTELLAETQVRLGTALLDSGDIDLAQTTLDSASAIYRRRQTGSVPDTAELWTGLARVAFLRNDLDGAMALAQRADAFWQARGDQDRWAGEAAYWHGRILVAAGREEAGRRTLLRATRILQQSPFARDRKLLALL